MTRRYWVSLNFGFRPFAVLPTRPGTGGEHQKAAVGATGRMRHDRPFRRQAPNVPFDPKRTLNRSTKLTHPARIDSGQSRSSAGLRRYDRFRRGSNSRRHIGSDVNSKGSARSPIARGRSPLALARDPAVAPRESLPHGGQSPQQLVPVSTSCDQPGYAKQPLGTPEGLPIPRKFAKKVGERWLRIRFERSYC